MWLELPISETCVCSVFSPARPHRLDVAHQVLSQTNAKNLWMRNKKSWKPEGPESTTRLRGTDLQQRYADEDPRHQREVVLQPLLKLGHAAFNVDVVLLLGVLRAHKHVSNIHVPGF